MTTNYESWHKLYCRITGMDVPYTMQRIFTWEKFLETHNCEQLETVVAHIKKRIHQKRRFPESLAFRNLIGNLDRFEEDLAEARAENRAWIEPDKARVLRATGRPERTHAPAKPAAEVVQKLIADLRRAVE